MNKHEFSILEARWLVWWKKLVGAAREGGWWRMWKLNESASYWPWWLVWRRRLTEQGRVVAGAGTKLVVAVGPATELVIAAEAVVWRSGDCSWQRGGRRWRS